MATSPEYPKRIPEKLKTIRERLGLTPDEIALKVGARTGAEILAYESNEDDLLVSILFGYAKLANIPVENLLHDDQLLLPASTHPYRSLNAMPQPQPNNPDVMRIIGRCITVIAVISVLIVVLGLVCRAGHTLGDVRKPISYEAYAAYTFCLNILKLGFWGIFVAFCLKVFLKFIVQK